jgi:sigma-B regulation protein RsbU (phosphoserine phosphatase)
MKKRHDQNLRPRFGVFGSWFHGDYQFELVSGIEYEAKRHDVQVFYFTGRSLHSPHPYENNYNIIFDTALDASLDGLVIMPMIPSYSTVNQIHEFISRYSPIPLVTINFKTNHGNAILTNNSHGFRRLLQHLIEYHGYRKFAFVNGPDKNPDAMERSEIYTSTLHSYGILFDSSLVINGHFIYLSGKKAIATFFDDRKLKPGSDIEVIICANDLMARGALDGLEARGIRVPSDIALTGFDGIRYAVFPKTPVTTVRQYVFEMGSAAIANLLHYDPEREDLVFDTELIIRTSCGCSGNNTMDPYMTHLKQHEIQEAASGPIDSSIPETNIGISG